MAEYNSEGVTLRIQDPKVNANDLVSWVLELDNGVVARYAVCGRRGLSVS